MKKVANFIQKLILLVFYMGSILTLDKQVIIAVTLIMLGLSFMVEGAKPYSPLLALIIVLEYFEWSRVQLVVIVVMGVLLTLIKFYDIPIPGKGELNSGYKFSKFENVEIGIYYPSRQTGKKANWFPKNEYFNTMYNIFYVDPKTRRLPYFIFAFLTSFITKVKMPAYVDVKLATDVEDQEKNSYKVVLLSHGMGSNLNQYSSIAGWFASHGYIVVSVQHDHDRIMLDYRGYDDSTTPDQWRKFLYKERNKDLHIRVAEAKKVYRAITEGKLLDQHFQKQIKIQEVLLLGHSYGGSTMIEALSELQAENKASIISKALLLDPWVFPLSPSTYKNSSTKKLLVINSQTFFEVVPFVYDLEKKLHLLQEKNKTNMNAFMITKMNHVDQSDPSFVFGNLLEVFQKTSHHSLYEQIMQLNLVIMALFIEDKSKQEVVDISNKFCQETNLAQIGIEVVPEERTTRDLMIEFKESRKKIVDSLHDKMNYFKAILR